MLLARIVALLLAFVSWLSSGAVLLTGVFWGAGLRCDEACDGDGWRRTRDAWQWDGVVALGVIAFVAGTALVVSVWRRNRFLAAGCVVVGVGATLAMATALSPEWVEHLDNKNGEDLFLFFVGAAAPVLATLIMPSRRRPRPIP